MSKDKPTTSVQQHTIKKLREALNRIEHFATGSCGRRHDMVNAFEEKMRDNPAQMRRYQRERAIIEVTELFAKLMKEKKISRTKLSNKLGCDKSFVTHVMQGRNLTLKTISDFLWAMDESLCTTSVPLTLRYCKKP